MHKAIFGNQELADLFGVSKQTFQARIKQGYWNGTMAAFPPPRYTVAAGSFWTYEDLWEFIGKRQQLRYLTWKERNELDDAKKRLTEMGQAQLKDDGSVG